MIIEMQESIKKNITTVIWEPSELITAMMRGMRKKAKF
jgi:hypothetical protein